MLPCVDKHQVERLFACTLDMVNRLHDRSDLHKIWPGTRYEHDFHTLFSSGRWFISHGKATLTPWNVVYEMTCMMCCSRCAHVNSLRTKSTPAETMERSRLVKPFFRRPNRSRASSSVETTYQYSL